MFSPIDFLLANARTTPKAPAYRWEGGGASWSEMRQRVAKLTGALKELGVSKGDRVAILALNCHQFFEYYYAVWWAGAVVVPMNTRWSPAENAYALSDSEATVLFVDGHFAPSLDSITADCPLEHTVFIGSGTPPEGALDYEEIIASADPMATADCDGEDLAGLYYTGGTTGFPKGVMLSHRALWFNNVSIASGYDSSPGDVYLHAAPMFHLADGGFSGAATAGGAACHVFLAHFDPNLAMQTIERHQVTHSILVPTMLGMLVASPEFEPDRLRSLRQVGYGASPMPQGLMMRLLESLPTTQWVQGYGQTEMAPVITLLLPEYHVAGGSKLGSAGRPAIGVEVKICDDSGDEVAPGVVGEIVARSPGTMNGYWKMPEQTQATLVDGWVKTGDGAYQDEDGFIFIVDRMKDMIVSGGENVFSAEVESALSTHDAVASVAVIGIPDERWGEAVHAIVIAQPDVEVSEASLMEHCRTLIANYKCPRSIAFRNEPFPLSGAGKVLKTELRKPYWEGAERRVN